MKDKLKDFIIPFVLMIVLNLGSNLLINNHFGIEMNPHYGIIFISGLLFGPFGVMGSTIGNFICDLINGYNINCAVLYIFLNFGISYLAYKLWYTKNQDNIITKIRLNSTGNMLHFFLIVLECGLLFAILSGIIINITYPHTIGLKRMMQVGFFVNFINFSLIYSAIVMWISIKKDFTFTPENSKRSYNEKIYKIIGYLLSITTVIILLLTYTTNMSIEINIIELVIILLLIFAYATKPIKNISKITYITIPEKIIIRFLSATLILILVSGVLLSTKIDDYIFSMISTLSQNHIYTLELLTIDLFVLFFFIPTYYIIRYIEKSIVKPIMSFSKIESRIIKDKRIESDDLINIYSEYSGNKDEIGMLSRSYIDLINYNNDYIENIKKTESEKQRIKTELNIAHKIQESILPKDDINNDYYRITGYSKPAKEVGGDFFDYYEIDEDNVVLVIGDASGKGIPAAIFTTFIQNTIKQLIKYEKDPAKVLYDVNNQICENNPECMFITLWLCIFNKKTHKLVFANAGHNPPLIKDNEKFRLLHVESEIVLGIMDDYKFSNDEITLNEELFLYTDGITDAQNNSHDLYGEKRLVEFLNQHFTKENLIKELYNNIQDYIQDEEQFDDMTVLYMSVKNN